MAQQMESLRLRILFNNPHILTNAQISQGLDKTWLFLPSIRTHLTTVDALSTYITQSFNLHHSCPNGLLLYMDGFVLPPFESTCILKDKDIISVKKNEVLAILGNETTDGGEGFEIVQKRRGNTTAVLLANEEFDSESGGCRSEEPHDEPSENDEDKSLEGNVYLGDGNNISKKRKALEKLQCSKKKKQRSEPHESVANDILPEPVARDHENGVLAGEKSTSKKRKSSKKNQTDVETIENGDEKIDKDVESPPKSKKKSSKKNRTSVGTIENGDEKIDKLEESTPKSKQKSSKKNQTNVGTIENGDDKIDKDAESTPKSSHKKKQLSEPHENAVHAKPVGGHHENVVLSGEKSTSKKRKSSKKTKYNVGSLGTIESSDEEIDKDVDSTPKSKRNELAQENCKLIDGNTNVSENSPKHPSRSARRKKAKRKWLQEMAKIKNKSGDSQEVKNWKEMQSSGGKNEGISLSEKGVGQLEKEGLGNPKGLLHWNQSGENSKTWSNPEEENQNHNKQGNSNRNSSTSNEVVPIEIRPGHIRFEPLSEDADQAAQRSQASGLPVETFHWNGITSKKQGQRWGRDQGYVSQRNDYDQFKQGEKGKKWGTDKTSVHHGKDYEQSNQGGKNQWERVEYPVSHGNDNDQTKKENEMNVDTHTHFREQMDFDKLRPLLNLPKEGIVIAYRLLELSSSWTPEMSPYRVGKVSRYDSQSTKIMLMPLPEYPIVCKISEEEESTQQQDGNLYNEDGSLEIEFTSLIDVRIVKSDDLDPSASNGILDQGNGGSIRMNNMETPKLPDNKDESPNIVVQGDRVLDQGKPAEAPSTGNGVNLWEQFSEALSAKKEQLSKENSSSRSSWSHRVLKGSTLGPTMAFLRSENIKNKEMVM